MTIGESVNYVPAGFEDSDDEEGYDEDGFYCCENQFTPIGKSELQIFTENLLDFTNNNNVDDLRNELDKGISTGFDIDKEIQGSWSVLYYAIFNGSDDVVDFLVNERGANVNARNQEGSTTLITACSSTQDPEIVFRIVKTLITKDSKLVSQTNYQGETAMMHAACKGYLKVVEYLISLKVDSFDTISNAGWNSLFFAIDGKQFEVAKKLFEVGIDFTIRDCKGSTAKDMAEMNGATDILSLFPPEVYKYETPSAFLSYSHFETVIPNTLEGEKNSVPSYFPDIVCMLKSMDLEKFVPIFSQANISLEEFLTVDNERLIELGIEMPYQRKIIRQGLHNFYNGKWNNKSIWLPENIKTQISPVDLIYILANLLRQVVVVKCQLLYLKQLSVHQREKAIICDYFTLEHFEDFQCQIQRLKKAMSGMENTKRPLLILKQKQSIKSNVSRESRVIKFTKISIKVSIPIILCLTALKFLYRK